MVMMVMMMLLMVRCFISVLTRMALYFICRSYKKNRNRLQTWKYNSLQQVASFHHMYKWLYISACKHIYNAYNGNNSRTWPDAPRPCKIALYCWNCLAEGLNPKTTTTYKKVRRVLLIQIVHVGRHGMVGRSLISAGNYIPRGSSSSCGWRTKIRVMVMMM